MLFLSWYNISCLITNRGTIRYTTW